MLKLQKTWSCELVSKLKLELKLNKSCWLKIIWIPNIDLLILQKNNIKINENKQKKYPNKNKYTIHLMEKCWYY
jgi:hypothetical protein